MSTQQNLSEVKDGETVVISSISNSSLKVKLLEMGFSEGRSVRVLFRAPLGDPLAVEVNGYVLSLRKDEASSVEVELNKVDE
jgi:Fe2+ transport system protein FeoA